MKELRQCIRELRTMQGGPIRDVVLPVIAALEAVNARIAALEAGAPPKTRAPGHSREARRPRRSHSA
jgi:hypothetical protein